MARKTKTRKSEAIQTAAALATAVGAHPATIGRWQNEPGWRWGRGPWSLETAGEILRWREEEGAAKAEDSREGRQLRLAHLRLNLQIATSRAEGEALTLAKQKGEFLPRSEVEKLIDFLSRGLGKIHGRLLVKFPVPGLAEYLTSQIDTVCAQTLREIANIGVVAHNPAAYAAGRIAPPDPPSPATPALPATEGHATETPASPAGA